MLDTTWIEVDTWLNYPDIESTVQKLFQELYPQFSWHKNIAWISDIAETELIERLSPIKNDTKSNWIWLHQVPQSYSTLEQACHLDNIESAISWDYHKDTKGKIQSERKYCAKQLELTHNTSWEMIMRSLLRGKIEPEYAFDKERWYVAQTVWGTMTKKEAA